MLNNKRILIEVGPGIGDLIMMTPVLKALKEQYPDCKLSILTSKNSAPIIERIPYIDKIFTIDKSLFFTKFVLFFF